VKTQGQLKDYAKRVLEGSITAEQAEEDLEWEELLIVNDIIIGQNDGNLEYKRKRGE